MKQQFKATYYKKRKKVAPAALRTHCSILKKMTLCNGKPQPPEIWAKLKCWLDNACKCYKAKKAAVFDKEDLERWFSVAPQKTPIQLQKKCLAVVAFCGGLRASEDYNLT